MKKKFSVLFLFFISVTTHAQTLGQAVDNSSLVWTTGISPSSAWTGESQTYHYGGSAAMSVPLSSFNNGPCSIQTTVTGPGTLTFWWKVSSTLSGGQLIFQIGTAQQNAILDNVDWQPQTYYLGAGTQTLQWVASNYQFGGGSAYGYLDAVGWTPGATAPVVMTAPAGQSQVVGLNTIFRVAAIGTPSLAYQWRFNQTNILFATNAVYVVTNTQAANLGNYDVIITNGSGAITSSIAPLVLGKVTAWGDSSAGETYIPTDITNALMVVGGFKTSLILNGNGTVTAWGDNTSFQTNLPELTNVIALAASTTHCLALKSDGTVAAWGTNYYGEAQAPVGLSNVVAISAGYAQSLALRSDGTVFAWGGNFSGQTNVPSDLTNVVAISAENSSAALKADGTMVIWGQDSGFGDTHVPNGLTNVMAIVNGGLFVSALKNDGTVTAWGNPSFNWTNVPAGLTNAVSISGSDSFTAALRSDGTVIAWGNNINGATNVPAGLTNVVCLGIGHSHGLAVVGDEPPMTQVVVRNISSNTNGFNLLIPTQCGHVYRLEYQDNLGNSNWMALPLVAGNGTNIAFIDSSPSPSQRFYRVRRW